MKSLLIVSVAGLAIAACGPMAPGGGQTMPDVPDQSAPAGGQTMPPVAEAPDQCMASRYRYLVGKRRSEIPTQPAGAVWRVACTTCAITEDYSPSRLNIFFNEQTQIVEQVRCG